MVGRFTQAPVEYFILLIVDYESLFQVGFERENATIIAMSSWQLYIKIVLGDFDYLSDLFLASS